MGACVAQGLWGSVAGVVSATGVLGASRLGRGLQLQRLRAVDRRSWAQPRAVLLGSLLSPWVPSGCSLQGHVFRFGVRSCFGCHGRSAAVWEACLGLFAAHVCAQLTAQLDVR
jgi:hypothetical protein